MKAVLPILPSGMAPTVMARRSAYGVGGIVGYLGNLHVCSDGGQGK